jgi:sialate O-acetylesterase
MGLSGIAACVVAMLFLITFMNEYAIGKVAAMQFTVASIFTDNMVLQQGQPVPVWGTAVLGADITVTFRGQSRTATANTDGKWLVQLTPMPASAEPAELTISSIAANATIKFVNVLVGEVWVCSGQSNMDMPLCQTQNFPDEIVAANFPSIRLFNVPRRTAEKPVSDIPDGKWCSCTPESVSQFSAVAYFFGRELRRNLGVPVGLINVSWGGTAAESWISRDGLLVEPGVRSIIDAYDRDQSDMPAAMARWKAELAAIDKRTSDTGDTGWPRGWADMPEPSGNWKDIKLPSYWQAQGLNFSGVLWFRKVVDVPAAWAGKDLTLSIGATDKSDITYFNNVKVGSITMQQRPDSWSYLRTYTVPGKLVEAGKNIIAVRVHSDRYSGGMTGPADVMKLACPEDLTTEPILLDGVWRYAVEANYGLVTIPTEPFGPGNPFTPCSLFNGMIAPLTPFAMRGAIWYQGESNTDRTRQYRTLFPALINDWRRSWGRDDFAFYFVQLANYMGRCDHPRDSAWAELREAQAMTLKQPHTGMAVAIDIGEAGNIHPSNKEDVGKRLAFNALNQTYGKKDIVPCGPLFREMKREGKAIRLFFEHVAGGLECRGDKLEGFAVAGDDGKFVWAEARIDPAVNSGLAEDTVIVESLQMLSPVAVRYAWDDNPACNLYNRAGLPASPFRTNQD